MTETWPVTKTSILCKIFWKNITFTYLEFSKQRLKQMPLIIIQFLFFKFHQKITVYYWEQIVQRFHQKQYIFIAVSLFFKWISQQKLALKAAYLKTITVDLFTVAFNFLLITDLFDATMFLQLEFHKVFQKGVKKQSPEGFL